MLKVPESWCVYTKEPADSQGYTEKMNRIYTRFAAAYDGFIKLVPLWSRWLSSVLPYIQAGRILEVSFGPGYLLTKYPQNSTLYGLDYNKRMVSRAREKLQKANIDAELTQGNVETMPYPDDFFDTVVTTMAFSGYPDGKKALSELLRVLKPNGQLLLLDYDFPLNRNFGGWLMVKFIECSGDIMRDIGTLLNSQSVSYKRVAIGSFGSVQLFVVRKK